MILKLTNKSKNFYSHLGNVFGSREVENATGDRFYDDDNKIWYLNYDGGTPNVFVSVDGSVIKNVWAESRVDLIRVLKQINKEVQITRSVVPLVFREEYLSAGFGELSSEYVKFTTITGGNPNE